MSPDEPLQVVVWRLGTATLAVPLDRVVEVAVVSGGRARSRGGELGLTTPRGLRPGHAQRAVVVRAADGLLAFPAERVEGVAAAESAAITEPPRWLDRLRPGHFDRLIRLDDDRVAALLAVEGVAADA